MQSWFTALPDITFILQDTSVTKEEVSEKLVVNSTYTSSFTNTIDYVLPDIKVFMKNNNNNTEICTFQHASMESMNLDDMMNSFTDDQSNDLFSLFELLEDESIQNSATTNEKDLIANETNHNGDMVTEVTEKIPIQFTKNTCYRYAGTFSVHLNAENKIERFIFLFKLLDMKQVMKRKFF